MKSRTLIPILASAATLTMAGCRTATHLPPDPMPAFSHGARILFQGDSITDGNRGRSADPNHILGHGYAFLIASRYGDELADRQLVFLNRGISGHKVSDLAARWQKDTVELKPDVLSILIGINDLNAGVGAQEYERGFDELLAATTNALPRAKLVLCEPFGLPVGGYKANWEKVRADLATRQAIVERLGRKYGAPVVHFQQAFDEATKRAPAEYWMWDGIHPTYSGHQVMAKEWVGTVQSTFNTPASR